MTKLSSPAYHTSDLSQFCDEHLGPHFNFLDGDEVLLRYSSQGMTHARSSGVLRIIESKRTGEEVRRSQREVLPLLARAIELAVQDGTLAAGSGVFILEGESPYDEGAKISRVKYSTSRAAGLILDGPHNYTRAQVDRFVSCGRCQRAETVAA